MRSTTLVLVVLLVGLVACNDLRDFRGHWHGPRVGASPVLRVGVALDSTGALTVDAIDTHGIRGTLSVDGLATDVPFASLDGAEADALAGLTFSGAPLRVYLAFVEIPDGGGQALAVIALYDDRRVELRVLRGGTTPLYAIFALTEGP